MRRSEAKLIAAFLAGEAEAVAEIDGWIQQAAWSFRRRLQDEWEDALQEVRMEVTRLLQANKFRGDSSLKTYLWRVACNACVDRVRARRKVYFDDLETVDQQWRGAAEPVPESARRREDRELALKVLAEMPEDCRRLWRMLFAGLSYRQMSEELGVSQGALRVRVLRCRRRALAVRDELLTLPTGTGGNAEGTPPPK